MWVFGIFCWIFPSISLKSVSGAYFVPLIVSCFSVPSYALYLFLLRHGHSKKASVSPSLCGPALSRENPSQVSPAGASGAFPALVGILPFCGISQRETVVSSSGACRPVPPGVCVWNCRFLGPAAGCWALRCSQRPRGPRAARSVGAPRQDRQKSAPRTAPKSWSGIHVSLFFFPPKGEGLSWEFPPSHNELCQLGGRATMGRVQRFSYPFQRSCSWHCACLGHCNCITCFWSSHKGISVHIFLLGQVSV